MMDNFDKTFVGFWVASLIGCLIVWAVVIWAIIQLVQWVTSK